MLSQTLAALLFVAPLAAQSAKPPVDIQILAINDFHGNLEPPTGSDGLINKTLAGGSEYLATHLANAAKDNPNTLVVAAGDLFGASPLLSGLAEDRPAIEAMNAMHVSITSIGNHELDHGSAELMRHIKDAKWQYLAANVIEATSPNPGHTLFPATAIRTIGGVKIGFIGETLKATDAMIGEQSAHGLQFLEESAVANKAAAELERQGVHTIVLLIHQGGFQNNPPGTTRDPNGCVGFAGDLQPVLDHLSSAIKVIVSAHTHSFYNCTIDGRTFTSASSYGRMFTRIHLTVDSATDNLLSVSATNEVVTRDVAKDPVQTAIIEKYLPETDRLRNRVLGSISGEITKHYSEAGENTMGELIADAQLAATSSPANGGSQIAFMNTGGIRADLEAPTGMPYPHDVTYGDLYTAQPFGNRLTTFTLTGEQLRHVLEQQFNVTDKVQFLQISTGFNYQYRLHAEAGKHITSMTLNGHEVAPTDHVRIVATDFVAQGSGSLTALRERTDIKVGNLDLEALIAYFATHSPVAPGPLSRIIRLD